MTSIKLIPFLTFLILTLSACGKAKSNRTTLGKSYAVKELESALAGKIHGAMNTQALVIKDSVTAINVAEPILFGIYGKENIAKQRPYEIYLIDKYWIIRGTLPEKYFGGTFLIIIDAKDSRVIKVTHGK